jgi:hypothetical protein
VKSLVPSDPASAESSITDARPALLCCRCDEEMDVC